MASDTVRGISEPKTVASVRDWLVTVAAFSGGAVTIFNAFTDSLSIQIQRPLLLGICLVIVFSQAEFLPARTERPHPLATLVFEALPVATTVACIAWVISTWTKIYLDPELTAGGVVLGTLLVLLVLEGTRRSIGFGLVAIAVAALLYAYFGEYLPTFVGHRGYNIERIVLMTATGSEGIFSLPMAVLETMVIFLIFGKLMEATGAAGRVMDLANAVAGKSAGGPAKVAVIGSAMFGMMTGSSVANVALSGVVTIPMMVKVGFPRHVAAAVEAVTSVGSQKMPPIMGATVFLIAEITGAHYGALAVMMIVPAILHYLALFSYLHFFAKRKGILPDATSQSLAWGSLLRGNAVFFATLIVLIIFLVDHTPRYAILVAGAALVMLSSISKSSRISLRQVLAAISQGTQVAAPLACAVATAGLVLGVLSITGLSGKLAEIVDILSGGNGFAALLLTAAVSLVLGAGLPTIVCYAILAVLVAPALVQLGFPLISSHLFIFYFAILSALSPPDCLASFTAARIAGAGLMRTAGHACLMATVLVLIPFAFMYFPGILLNDSFAPTAVVVLCAAVGTFAFAISLAGYAAGPLCLPLRLAALAVSLNFYFPFDSLIQIPFGAALFVLIFVLSFRRKSGSPKAPGESDDCNSKIQP